MKLIPFFFSNRWASYLLVAVLGLSGMGLTLGISAGIQRTLEEDLRASFQRSLEVYRDLKFGTMAPYIMGYTHWTDLSEEISSLEPGEPLGQDMAESWLSGNSDANDGCALFRNGEFLLTGGTDWPLVTEMLDTASLKALEEALSSPGNTETRNLLIRKSGRVLFLLAGPLCDDLGVPSAAGIALFARFWNQEDEAILAQLTQSDVLRVPSSGSLEIRLQPTDPGEAPMELFLVPQSSPQIAVRSSLFLGFAVQAGVLALLAALFVGALGSLRSTNRELGIRKEASEAAAAQFVSLRGLHGSMEGFSQEFSEAVEDFHEALTGVRNRLGAQALETMGLFQQSLTLSGNIEDAQKHIQTISHHIGESLTSLRENTSLTDTMQKKNREMMELTEKSSAIAQDLQQEALESFMDLEVSARDLEQLAQESLSITKVVELIEDIAARTNLLSINAAIESARAGAGGRGFAVVAEEIRKLASSAAQNSQSIRGQLEGISRRIQETASRTQDMKERLKRISEGAEENLHLVFESSEELKSQGQSVQGLVVSNHLMLHISQELEAGINQETGVLREALQTMRQFEDFNSKSQRQTAEGLEQLGALLLRINLLQEQFASGTEFIRRYGEMVTREPEGEGKT